jgi:hypothetical protein
MNNGDKQGLDDFLMANLGTTLKDIESLVIDQAVEADIYQIEKAKLESRYAVVGARVLDCTNRTFYAAADFMRIVYPFTYITLDGKPASIAKQWLGDRKRREYAGLTHRPGQPQDLPDGYFNLSPPIFDIPRDPASIERYYEGWTTNFVPLISHVFGGFNTSSAVTFLQWNAAIIQNPGVKLFTALLLYGPQGAGKSLAAECVAGAHPDGEAMETEAERLLGKFNDQFAGVALLLLNELLIDSDRRKTADKIKNAITRREKTIEAKFGHSYNATDFTNLIFTTNHHDAAFLESDDRRLIVLKTNQEPLDSCFGTRVGEWARSLNGRRTMRFFLEKYPTTMNMIVDDGEEYTHQAVFDLKHYFEAVGIDLKQYFKASGIDLIPFDSPNLEQETATTINVRRQSFHATDKAPMTGAKLAMIEASRSSLDDSAFDLIEEARRGEDGKPCIGMSHDDLITPRAAAERQGITLDHRNEKAWSNALIRQGAIRLGRARIGKPLHILALNHANEWLKKWEKVGSSVVVDIIKDNPKNKCLSGEEKALFENKRAKY